MSEQKDYDAKGFYIGNIKGAADFALCSEKRQKAVLTAFGAVMDNIKESLNRADERLAKAEKAVEEEIANLASERETLAMFMALWLEFQQVVARSYAVSIENAAFAAASSEQS